MPTSFALSLSFFLTPLLICRTSTLYECFSPGIGDASGFLLAHARFSESLVFFQDFLPGYILISLACKKLLTVHFNKKAQLNFSSWAYLFMNLFSHELSLWLKSIVIINRLNKFRTSFQWPIIFVKARCIFEPLFIHIHCDYFIFRIEF